MIKRIIIIILFFIFISNVCFAELNLKPKIYEKGDIVEEQVIAITPEEWKKVVEEIKDLREKNEIRKEQLDNSKVIQKQYIDLLENSKLKINLYKENSNLYKEELKLYKEELNIYQDKYIKVLKFNSYRTGFVFILGISVAILSGWVFSEIAK